MARFTRTPALSLICGLAAALAGPALAHEGDPALLARLRAPDAPSLRAGSPAAANVRVVVRLAAGIASERGGPLLPPGTIVDAARWNGTRLDLDLTLPLDDEESWQLTPTEIATLSHALGGPFEADPAFAGVLTRIRFGPHQPYDSLERALPHGTHTPPAPETPADDTPLKVGTYDEIPLGGPDNAFGPTQHGSQPAGALSGVTVYISAGHGWTAGASAWALQRPVLLGMAEDYGNIDQLNYFAHYLFNAGATVVPLRPVGWQPVEVVLDQDDPGVTYSGTWTDSGNAKYFENGVTNSGVAYRFSTATTSESAVARYTPTLPFSDFYPVYTFVIASSNRVTQTYRIRHSGGTSEVRVNHRDVGNGWVWLGDYHFDAAGESWLEISNASPIAGAVVADGVRWGGGFGDISRPGPGSISGYPRDEEAQRYWGEGQLGNNAVGFDSGIWDLGGMADIDDNIGTGARIAREMNQVPAGGVQVDRWKRVHLEFHTNAFNGAARGQLTLITDLGATTNQTSFANILSNEVDADLLLADADFEHVWVDRSSPTLTGSYGAIATTNNSNEFDATLVELAFHDNETDAELLRDPRVRAAMARACTHGIIKFLNSLTGSQVPFAFPPDTPRDVAAVQSDDGNVLISWQPPLVDGARGDAATGYVVYQSSNGLGFGDPIVLGNVLSTTVSGLAVGETRYFRVAASNSGGQSMPTEVLAVNRPANSDPRVLIVNGFDRLRRDQDPVLTFTQPPNYAGLSVNRQRWRLSNSFDYVIEHAQALAANQYGFSSCSNEAVANSRVDLANFDIVVWILGVESTEDRTFTPTEQTRVSTFLSGGGSIFVSGADLGFDLIANTGGVTFAQDTLRVRYSTDDAGTYAVNPAGSGIFSGMASFDFDPAGGAAYRVDRPDVLLEGTGALGCLNYATGGIAGVQYVGGVYNTVCLGFPFEAISDAAVRSELMRRAMEFLDSAAGPLQFDFDNDGDVDFDDYSVMNFCHQGPGLTYPPGFVCLEFDDDADSDVDMHDLAAFQEAFTGP